MTEEAKAYTTPQLLTTTATVQSRAMDPTLHATAQSLTAVACLSLSLQTMLGSRRGRPGSAYHRARDAHFLGGDTHMIHVFEPRDTHAIYEAQGQREAILAIPDKTHAIPTMILQSLSKIIVWKRVATDWKLRSKPYRAATAEKATRHMWYTLLKNRVHTYYTPIKRGIRFDTVVGDTFYLQLHNSGLVSPMGD